MLTEHRSTYVINARESVMLDCCLALIFDPIDSLMDIFPGIEKVSEHLFYLNDGDTVLPPIKVFKRKATMHMNLTLYEGEFGPRRTDTDDFDKEPVLQVVSNLHLAAFRTAAEKVHTSPETLQPAVARINAAFDTFRETFRPEDSLRFREQPPAPSQKFWIDKEKNSKL
ncbi:MAG: hypothetical protein ABJM43_12955 [Paracoccaceae bacterium]